ncbi:MULTISPECIES: hypothetical protein [unclassified Wolbachia]|uniref:hypothetical protein n=1 Tax=unclassified Wolbachia TaxID=2640676 RepID=UPI00222E8295|nr:hypothetical protein [Wolbachia endosymbiont (group A) of Epistrophe grossularia]
MEGKINSAKSKLGTSFNKEAVRRVINKLVNDYLKILPTSFGVKESLLSYMKCVDIDDYRGRMDYESVNCRVISRANEVILSESNEQNNLGDGVEGGLHYIVDNVHVSLFIEVEQEMLNEIAGKAENYRERDSKKKDLELLAICNGGKFQDKRSLPTDLGFSEIERLYKDMLSIAFKWGGEFEAHTLYERLSSFNPCVFVGAVLLVSGVVSHIMKMHTIAVVGIISGLACISLALYGALEPSTKLEKVEQSFQSNAREHS